VFTFHKSRTNRSDGVIGYFTRPTRIQNLKSLASSVPGVKFKTGRAIDGQVLTAKHQRTSTCGPVFSAVLRPNWSWCCSSGVSYTKLKVRPGCVDPLSPPLPLHLLLSFSSLSPFLPLSSFPLNVAPLNPARGPGESYKLPQRGVVRSPSRNRIRCISALKYDIWWQRF